MKKRISLLKICCAAILLTASSCAKHAPGPQDKDVSDVFSMIVIPDSKVDMSQPVDLKSRLKIDAQGQVTFKSSDWLDASRRMFESADSLSSTKYYEARLRLIKMGHELGQNFYSYSNSATTMSATMDPVPGNPFLEEAYFYVKDILDKQYADALIESASHVDIAAQKVKVDKVGPFVDDSVPINTDSIVDVPIHALEDFEKNMRALDDDTTRSVTDQLSTQIQDQYITGLNQFKAVLKPASETETALSYATRLQKAIDATTLIPDEYKAQIKAAMPEVFYFANKVALCTDVQSTLQTTIDLWEAVDQRAKYPTDVRLSVEKLFAPFKDSEVVEMLDDDKDKLVPVDQWPATASKKPDLMKSVLADPGIVNYVTKNLMTDPVDPKQQGADIFAALVNDWYDMDFRSNLIGISQIWALSPSDMKLLRDPKAHLAPPLGDHPILSIKKKVLSDTLTKFSTPFPYSSHYQPGLDWLRGYVNYEIIYAVQKALGEAINTFTEQIPQVITEAFHDQVKNMKPKADVLTMYKSLLPKYLDQWFFQGKSIPMIERNQVKFQYSGNTLNPLPSADDSGAEVLGVSLSDTVERLATLEYVSTKPDQPEIRAMGFQALCKLAALTGYVGVNNKPVASLLSPFSKDGKGPAFDVSNYDPDKATYAAADDILLKDNFRLDPTTNKAPKASVRGQMELLRGLTKMIQYLKPWSPSSFDIGLQNLHITEFPSQTIFSKSTYFMQSLGLASTIIKNLPSRMVAILTGKGLMSLAQINDLSDVDLRGAVVSDFDRDGVSHVIRTHDLATAVIAINEFFDTISDLSRSSDQDVRDAADEIESQRPIVQELFQGISMFAAKELMADDGGFATSYDVDKSAKSTEPRVLQDQLLMEEAMIDIGNFLNSNFIRSRAIDNFFFLNGHFWNPVLGFYNQSEGKDGQNVSLADVAQALKATVLVNQVLTPLVTANAKVAVSLKQIDDIQNFLLGRFFDERTAGLPTVLKLGTFSPANPVAIADSSR